LRWWSVLILVLAMRDVLPGGARGGTPTAQEIEAQAMAILERTAQGLSQAQRFSATVDIGYDVVQASGQTIEFGETRTVVVHRPDCIRGEDWRR
jgi:hypothetical protein